MGAFQQCLNRLFVFISALYKFIQQGLADCHSPGPVFQVLLPQSKMFALADFPLLLLVWHRRSSFYYPELFVSLCPITAVSKHTFTLHYKGAGKMHTHYIFEAIDFIVLYLFAFHFSCIKQFNNKSISTR